MKAIAQDRYGGPETLELREVERPQPADHEVLVRVRASCLNAADWHIMRGAPYVARLSVGLRAPRASIRGSDVAGVVEEVGAAVRRWRPGDEVYGEVGMAGGAFAEYAAVAEDLLQRKPDILTFEEAAAVPLAGRTALVCLREAGAVRAGHRVLVNGASGGVGTFAVQLGHALGAEVTGVCRTRNVDLVRSLGAKHVVDYTREDFTDLPASGARYDVVLDLVGNRSLADLRRVLAPGGVLVLSGGGTSGRPRLLGPVWLMVRARLLAPFLRLRAVVPQTPQDAGQLADLAALVAAGTITPVVDRSYPLAQVPEAMTYLETEHAQAKVVVSVE